MEIKKVNNDILKKSGDYKREVAKQTIENCIKQGAGCYEVLDNEHIFTSNVRMLGYLQIYTRRHCMFNKESDYIVEVRTKNKGAQVFVVVSEKNNRFNI